MGNEPANAQGEDGYLTFHSLQHHYIRWGDPGADPIVLLHGFFDHARSLEPVAARLAADHAVYALDLRGHGETTHAPGGYLVWAFARDLHAFVQELDLEVFDLVGIGMGSRIAMTYARDHSHRINHLVLAEMGPEPLDGTGDNGTGHRSFATEAEALEHFATLYPGESREFHMRQLMASLELDETTGHLVFRFDPGLRGLRDEATRVEIPFLWESLEHITTPVLVIRGSESDALPRDVAEEMCQRLPNGRIAEVPGRSYQVPGEVPDEFASAIAGFIAG